jgi:hypothetical protein
VNFSFYHPEEIKHQITTGKPYGKFMPKEEREGGRKEERKGKRKGRKGG